MSFKNNNNNNDQPTTIVYTPISFANPEFNEGSRFSVSYFNRLLKVSIAKKNGTNGEFATYDNDNTSVIYLSHMKAKILYELIQQMQTDDTIHNVCVETNKGLFIVSDGQEFGSNTPCFVIKSADNNGNISSIIYQTKNNYNGAINYSDDGYTDRLIEGVELETFETSHKSDTYIVSNFSQLENISSISVTFDVLKLLKSKVVNPLHCSNIQLISVTFDVSKLLKSKFVSFKQHVNIPPISVTFEVLKLLKFNSVNSKQQ